MNIQHVNFRVMTLNGVSAVGCEWPDIQDMRSARVHRD